MYGTLADPSSLTAALEDHVDDPARVAAVWRRQQLEISWLLSIMGRYEDWVHVTHHALLAALTEIGTELSGDQLNRLLEQTRVPALFDDVTDALEALTENGHELALLSNGTAQQLETIIDRTGIAGYFTHVISVDEIGVYKPAPAVYTTPPAGSGERSATSGSSPPIHSMLPAPNSQACASPNSNEPPPSATPSPSPRTSSSPSLASSLRLSRGSIRSVHLGRVPRS